MMKGMDLPRLFISCTKKQKDARNLFLIEGEILSQHQGLQKLYFLFAEYIPDLFHKLRIILHFRVEIPYFKMYGYSIHSCNALHRSFQGISDFLIGLFGKGPDGAFDPCRPCHDVSCRSSLKGSRIYDGGLQWIEISREDILHGKNQLSRGHQGVISQMRLPCMTAFPLNCDVELPVSGHERSA